MNEKEAIKYLLSFVPDWAMEVPKGLDPTFYDAKKSERIPYTSSSS